MTPIITQVIEYVNTKVIHRSDAIAFMETSGQRLKRLREAKGLSQGALATQAGLKSQGTIGNIERETRGYGDSVVDIARVLGVTPEYLRGDHNIAESLPYSANKVRDVFVVGRGNGGLMPESIWTDGDYPVGATDECAEVATTDPQAFLVRVEGPSMIPRYNPGEFALVEPGTTPDLEDDVLVRLSTGQTMIKRLLSRRDGYLFGSYNAQETQHFTEAEVSWIYYIAHPVPRRKIKARC